MLNEHTRVHCVVKGLFDSKCWGTSNIRKSDLCLLLLDQVCEQFIYPVLLRIYVIKSNSKVGTLIPSYIFSPKGCFLAGIVVSHASGRDGSFFGFLITSFDSWYNKANLSNLSQHGIVQPPILSLKIHLCQILLYSLNIGTLTYRPWLLVLKEFHAVAEDI